MSSGFTASRLCDQMGDADGAGGDDAERTRECVARGAQTLVACRASSAG